MLSLFRRTKPIRTRTDLINHLMKQIGGTRYLEIGVRDRRHNFDKIEAETKHGVDPAPRRPITHQMTSDDFFANGHAGTYDIVFVDGLHLAHQVELDVENALGHLRPDGFIVLHDCNPMTEDAQSEDYEPGKHWNGTVWKAWVKLRATRRDLAMHVVNIDEGCGVIRRGSQTTIEAALAEYADMKYSFLVENRRAVLNLVSVDEFLAQLSSGAPSTLSA